MNLGSTVSLPRHPHQPRLSHTILLFSLTSTHGLHSNHQLPPTLSISLALFVHLIYTALQLWFPFPPSLLSSVWQHIPTLNPVPTITSFGLATYPAPFSQTFSFNSILLSHIHKFCHIPFHQPFRLPVLHLLFSFTFPSYAYALFYNQFLTFTDCGLRGLTQERHPYKKSPPRYSGQHTQRSQRWQCPRAWHTRWSRDGAWPQLRVRTRSTTGRGRLHSMSAAPNPIYTY
jgi:hypothetical protein